MAWFFELLFQFIVEMIIDAFATSMSKRQRVGCMAIVAALFAGLTLFLFLR